MCIRDSDIPSRISQVLLKPQRVSGNVGEIALGCLELYPEKQFFIGCDGRSVYLYRMIDYLSLSPPMVLQGEIVSIKRQDDLTLDALLKQTHSDSKQSDFISVKLDFDSTKLRELASTLAE